MKPDCQINEKRTQKSTVYTKLDGSYLFIFFFFPFVFSLLPRRHYGQHAPRLFFSDRTYRLWCLLVRGLFSFSSSSVVLIMARGIQVFPSFIIGATGQGLIDSSLTRKRCNAVATQRLLVSTVKSVLFWSILPVDIVFLFCFSLLFIPCPVNWRNEMMNDFGDDQWWWNRVNLDASAIVHFSSVKFLFVGCVESTKRVLAALMCTAAGNIPDDWIVKGKKKKPFSHHWSLEYLKAIAFLRYGQVVWGLWTRFSLDRNRSQQFVWGPGKTITSSPLTKTRKCLFIFLKNLFLNALSPFFCLGP